MSKMPERMTKEEAKIQRAIEAARIAKQTLLEETRDRMPLEVDEEEVKVKRPKAENVTIKVPNQDKEGYGLAGVEEEYNIKKGKIQRHLYGGYLDDFYRIRDGLIKALQGLDIGSFDATDDEENLELALANLGKIIGDYGYVYEMELGKFYDVAKRRFKF
jgi:hypothetical protein